MSEGRHPSAPPPGGYRERLSVPLWWWLAAPLLAGLFAAEVFLGAPGSWTYLPYGLLVPLVLGGMWWLGRIRIAVTDSEFVVDDARLPLAVVRAAVVVDPLAKGDLLGPNAEAYAFVIQRPWVGGAVQVFLDDPADPTPYWLISSRRPADLVAALTPSSRPPARRSAPSAPAA
jgi:hypothetical protein